MSTALRTVTHPTGHSKWQEKKASYRSSLCHGSEDFIFRHCLVWETIYPQQNTSRTAWTQHENTELDTTCSTNFRRLWYECYVYRCEDAVSKLASGRCSSTRPSLSDAAAKTCSRSGRNVLRIFFLNRQSLNKYVAHSLNMCSATNLSYVLWCLRESGSQVMNRCGICLSSLLCDWATGIFLYCVSLDIDVTTWKSDVGNTQRTRILDGSREVRAVGYEPHQLLHVLAIIERYAFFRCSWRMDIFVLRGWTYSYE